MRYLKFLIFALPLIFIFAACSEDSSTGPEGEGSIKINMVDSSAPYDSVIIVVESVQVHSETDGWLTINNQINSYDLLQLVNGTSVVLGDTTLSAGKYTQIRLIVGAGSYVVVNGVPFTLEIPSGTQTGIKLTHQFTIEPNTLYELTLDFDVNKSIVFTGSGTYKLKPTIRVVPLVISGSITGQVQPIEAAPLVWTIHGSDTISTYTDLNGFFQLSALLEGSYDVHIQPSNPVYMDTTITNVSVTANQNTDLGLIIVSN